MAVLLIPEIENKSYIRLIEEQAHFYLPISQVKFDRYVNAQDLCRTFDTLPPDLYEFVEKSDSIHGVMCASGAFFVHPEGLTKHLRKWGLRAMKEKKAYNPFTKTEVLLC